MPQHQEEGFIPACALRFSQNSHSGEREREREREIHYVHWASKAYEDESVFMSEAHLGGGGGISLRPYSQQRPMRTNLS